MAQRGKTNIGKETPVLFEQKKTKLTVLDELVILWRGQEGDEQLRQEGSGGHQGTIEQGAGDATLRVKSFFIIE